MGHNTWRAKVSEYGIVSYLKQTEIYLGNPTYTAPEANDPTKVSPKLDIFSFGILLLEMFTGYFPNKDKLPLFPKFIGDSCSRLLEAKERR